MPVGGVHALGIRPDPATDVSLVFAQTAAAPGSADELDLLELFEALLARWTAHELVQQLAVEPDLRPTTDPRRSAGRSGRGSA